jgi:hypothetical protein
VLTNKLNLLSSISPQGRETRQAMHSDIASPRNFWACSLSGSNIFIAIDCIVLAGEAI